MTKILVKVKVFHTHSCEISQFQHLVLVRLCLNMSVDAHEQTTPCQ